MSATPTPISYTVWNPPGALFPIRYSLTLFREIEFFVGEGYRRIPHGGLEVGAVLYGHGEPEELTIQAFRPIESQHSFGPSFTLSPFDLEQLGKQVDKPLLTEAGDELEVVGWLVSNCRSDLVLTEQETRIYDEYFPGPRQVTLLAKPEKFKPTRYGFVARPRRGGLLEKACPDSFILPLSTKGDATSVREVSEETAALPAPLQPAVAALPPSPAREVQPVTPAPPPPAAPPPVVLASVLEAAPTPTPVVQPLAPPQLVEPAPTVQTPSPEVKVEAIALPVIPAPAESHIQPANGPAEATEIVTPSVGEPAAERSPESLPPARRNSILMLQPEAQATEILPEGPIERLRERRQSRSGSSWRDMGLVAVIIAVLAAAAVWAYLRLPAPPIPLNAEVQPGQVVVTWAPELTKNADRCSITTWTNGQPNSQPLSADEQNEGRAIIQTTSSDVTIQLRAPQWYQERSGQIRVFRIIPPPPPPVEPKPARRVFALPQGGSKVPPIVGTPADPEPRKPPQ